MRTATLPRTVELIERGIAEHQHIGAQLYLSLRGQVVVDEGFGEARAGVAMTPQTLMLWLSATKPIVAAAVLQQWEHGRLELDDLVAKHIPEFAAGGKEAITVRHVLTHTGGFRGAASNWNPISWDRVIARISQAQIEPGWVPGKKAGYHIASGWFVLAELVRRLDGRPFERYVREEIFLPLGMNDSWIGMPPEAYEAYGDRIGIMHDTAHAHPKPQPSWDTEEFAAICRPGANGRGPIRELGRFYEAMLGHGRLAEGRRILSPQGVEAMVARHRVGMFDQTFKHTMDWGLGVIVNSWMYEQGAAPYGFGPFASPRTFGHGGYQSSGGYADPEHALAVAFVFNGTPGEARHDQRIRALNAAIYEDLGLTP